jgi:preprotein translocase subunit SecA
MLARVRVRSENDIEEAEQKQRRQAPPLQYQHADAGSLGVDDEAAQAQGLAAAGWDAADEGGVRASQSVRSGAKVGRNDPCPCGSGKKYKACHGKLD